MSLPAPSAAPADEPPYGWVVAWACFASLGVIFGVAYSFAAFFDAFGSEFQARRADVALVFGLSGLIYFALGPVAGLLADRYGPRRVCTAGMLCIAGGLLGSSFARHIGQVYAAYGVGIGLGIALVYTPAIAAVQPWFHRRRGLAAGLASAGIGAGTLAVPLIATALMGALHWRSALQWLALGALLLGAGATLLIRRAPAATAQRGAAVPGLTLRQALRSREFRWLYLAVLLASPVMFIPFAHVSAAARDMGIDEARAVGLVGVIGIGSLCGRFAIGSLADRIGRARTLALAQASLGLSYLVWGWGGGYAAMLVFALWLGLSYGGMVALMPALCMDLFGARAVSSILGTLYSAAALGNLAGPVLAGWVFDRTGGYGPVIMACLLLSVVGTAACAQVLRRPVARQEVPS
jgi:MFS family permease